MIRARNETSVPPDGIDQYYDKTSKSDVKLKLINNCTDTMSSNTNQILECSLLFNNKVQSQPVIHLEENASNNNNNDGHSNYDNDSKEINKLLDALLLNDKVRSQQIINLNESTTKAPKYNHRDTSFNDNSSEPPKLLNKILTNSGQYRQITNFGKNTSKDSDCYHNHNNFNYDLSQTNNYGVILPSSEGQTYQIKNLETNISNDTNYNHRDKSLESMLSVDDINTETNHLNNSKTSQDDQFIQFNLQNLGDDFIECLLDSSGNKIRLNDDINLNNLLKTPKENETTLKKHQILKRKCLITNENEYFDNFSMSHEIEYVHNNKIMKFNEVDTNNDLRQNTKLSCLGVTVTIPNTYEDQSAEQVPQTNISEKFLQNSICLTLPPDIDKCVECNITLMNNNLTQNDYDNVQCRFFEFRELKFTNFGQLAIAGYPDPFKNISDIDLDLWRPGRYSFTPSNFNIQASIKILKDAGGELCKVVQGEKEALKLNPFDKKDDKIIIWKKCVKGIREMCDVCQTTIFNYHWSCLKCGFVVCIDCIKNKICGNKPSTKCLVFKQDNPIWLLCSNREEHQLDQLTVTQILAGNSLDSISTFMHDECIKHKIPLKCSCYSIPKPPSFSTIVTDKFLSDDVKDKFDFTECNTIEVTTFLEHYTIHNDDYDYDYNDDGYDDDDNDLDEDIENLNCHNNLNYNKNTSVPNLPIKTKENVNVPHMWLCDGLLLQLLDSDIVDNYDLFQEQWIRGQPVLVSGVGKRLNKSLWHPESFSRDFGDQTNDLINCSTGEVVSNQPMSKFWDGFENGSKRLCDNNGYAMMLKLKDWPQSEDFAETLPDRFEDLMNCLPLKEYTQRTGRYNLASHLPEFFVRPDLGPKMYIAYGNAGTTPKLISTTNLHLDMSDAINVMVYVAITNNCNENSNEWYVKEAFDVIEDCGCDDLSKKRVYVDKEIPGALWHIYHADEADAIRDLLYKIDVEQGLSMEESSDPIHDQSHYLDKYHRERLYKEYGIKGYTIIQCEGDAVFIPAGAPHQVRNLHNCIKVAEDFVSPENIHQSFRMTQEFRNLTDNHTNHEDKLQLKNILFHAVKNSISVLMHAENT